MKAHSRIRRVFAWAETILCLTVFAVWLLSGFRWIYVSDGRHTTAYAQGGVLEIHSDPSPGIRATLFATEPTTFRLWPAPWLSWRPFTLWDTGPYGGTLAVRLPLMLPLAALLLVTGLLWLWPHRRRIPPGHCRKCGYDLTGNISGRCPECGAPTPVAAG